MKRFLFILFVLGHLSITLLKAQHLPDPYMPGVVKNFIRTWDAMAPETDANNLMTRPLKDVKQVTQYIDGLGRPLQTVIKQGSLETGGTATDMVSAVVYDEFGREQYKYLPSPANNTGGNPNIDNGLFKLNPFQQQAAFMTSQYGSQGETFFYSKTNFEASPLNRVEKTMAPGNSWVGNNKGAEAKYWINTATDDVKIWNVTDVANTFGTYAILTTSNNGVYAAGELYKNATVDEHGKQVIEFKDKEGKVILKKVQLDANVADDGSGKNYTGWLCTYYIYDDLNNLRCVIQPEGVKYLSANNWPVLSTAILNEQCFRYEYDERNRMVIKKVPGAGEVWMVYDKRDRLVLTQDANLHASNKWLFTKYDLLNRPIMTGFFTNATYTTQSSMQGYLNSESMGFGETFDISSFPIYSVNQTFPVVNYSTDVLTVNYYDNYDWSGWYGTGSRDNSNDSYFQTPSNTFPYPQSATNHSAAINGMVTGQWQKNGELTCTYYDDKGRVIQTKHFNFTGGIDATSIQYSFSGQPLLIIAKTMKGGTNPQTTILITQMAYDDLGRISKVEKKISNTLVNGDEMSDYKTIVQNEYDALGQLKKKKLAPAYNSNAGLETLTYDYNIRGWMLGTNRNYLKNLGTSGYEQHYFGFELGYDKVSNNSGTNFYHSVQYNGNIMGMVWKSAGDQVRRKYDFRYDAVNRLGTADFTQNTTEGSGANFINTEMDFSVYGDNPGDNWFMKYDDNGNILSMVQRGYKLGLPTGPIDQLTYNYLPNSNKLAKVTDTYSDPQTKLGDFKDGNNGSSDDYSYDANGNLNLDNNKNISSITYNHLNLPSVITVTGKGTINYTYDAAGNKLKKEINETGQPLKTTLYLGGAVYENDVLQFIGHEEGRIRFKPANGIIPASFEYDYMLKDHLGNVRTVLTEEVQTTPYVAATMETSTINNEATYYGNLTNTQYNKPSWFSDPLYSTNEKVAQVKNAVGTQKVGPNILLKVMAGDSYHIRVVSGWKSDDPATNSNTDVLADLFNLLSSGVAGASG
ncbi:MAG TPA: DUF6443 domain-containing protein, partial [Chitinophagaceae bacterium]